MRQVPGITAISSSEVKCKSCLYSEHRLSSNCIRLKLDVIKHTYTDLLLDTGADVSLIKVGCINDNIIIDRNDNCQLSGISKNHDINTLGTFNFKIKLNNDIEIEHKMFIVGDDFPVKCSGILGRDFAKKFNIEISYMEGSIKIFYDDKRFVSVPISESSDSIFLASRSETFLDIEAPFDEDMVCLADEVQPNVFVGNYILKPDVNTSTFISIINANDSDIILKKFPRLEPLKQFHLLALDSHQQSSLTRKEKVREEILKNIDNNLNIEEKNEILSIIEDFSDIFHLKDEVLSCTDNYQHFIPLFTDTAPIYTRPYRTPQTQKIHVDNEVQKLLSEDIIEHSTSAWNSPILLVPKKPGKDGEKKYRLCVDYRELNKHTISDRHPLGNISDILDQLGHSRYFTTLDLASGFHQIPLHPDSKDKTAFTSGYGFYQFKKMPFGLKNAPAALQRFLNHILTGLQGIKCLVYLDDIIVYGKNLKDHNEKLIDVLTVLRQNNLKLQPSKCQFLQREIMYLGHIISDEGIKPDPTKISAVLKIPRPTNVKKLKSYLSMANYYRNFIMGFSAVTEPLNRLLRKNVPFIWTDECEDAFLLLKEKLTSPPVLAYPDFDKPFCLTTDASDFALGAVLSQKHDEKDCVVGYGGRSLNPAERNYNTTEKEMLGVVWAINNYRPYLYGRHFTVYSDHKPLLGDSKNPPLRILKWKLKLSEYSYEMKHKSGKQNVVADALSRVNEEVILIITRAQKARELESLNKNTTASLDNQNKNIENLKKNRRPMTSEEIDAVTKVPKVNQVNNKFHYIGDVKIVLDKAERIKLLDEAHNSLLGGHQGVFRTFKSLRSLVRWPYMLRDITKYIKNCKKCQKNKHGKNTKVPMAITSTSSMPFQRVFMDVVGPVPESENGNKYILTFQDDLTKYCMAAAIPNQETVTIAKTLFNSFISIIGIPETILTDQGSNFMSKLFAELCKLLKIAKINSSAWHPQTNQVERFHKPLASYLRTYADKDNTTWDNYLPSAVFCYNTHVHRTTLKTPFEMVFGRIPNIPSVFKKEPEPIYNYDDYVLDLKNRLQRMYFEVRQNIVSDKIISKKYYDRNAKPFIVKKGDFVWLKNEARDNKFSSLKTGPFEVIDAISPENTIIKLKNNVNKVVHNNRLTISNGDHNILYTVWSKIENSNN